MSLDFKPKLEKVLELLLYLAHARPNADKYQAVKFFYLADREHLNRYGRPITHDRYYALPFGPVASNAMDFLERDKHTLQQIGVEDLPFETFDIIKDGKKIVCIGKPLRDVDFDLFSKSDIKVFDEVLKGYGSKSFEDLFQLTHSHFAYRRAWHFKKPGSRRSPMRYQDMIEDANRREAILEDFAPVASHLE